MMWSMETGLEIAKLLTTLLSAFGIVWYWNFKKDALERYRHLDDCYKALLQLYFDHPTYGDEARTSDYLNAFQGDAGLRYHFFAMRVHTTMESLFDLAEGNIPEQWAAIFTYHTNLHRAWLSDHHELHEAAYARKVLGLAP